MRIGHPPGGGRFRDSSRYLRIYPHRLVERCCLTPANTVCAGPANTATETMEDAGFSVNQAGESPDGDWFKLQVKP